MNPKVDEFLRNVKQWQNELLALQAIALECGLTEEWKWRQPCYTYKGKNVAILGGFKDNCVFSFVKGVLLNDAEGVLVKPGENSQSVRFIRFTSLQQIVRLTPVLKAYIFEAIEVEKAGLKVELKDNAKLDLVEELQDKINNMPAFKTAFEALTPGRQRAYNMHFGAAKQSKTRVARIAQYTERILNGKGINDCVCGMSKRMPNCDGSHKYLNKA